MILKSLGIIVKRGVKLSRRWVIKVKTREQNIKTLLKHYEFDKEDAKNLRVIYDLLKEELESFLDEFYKFIFQFKHASFFIKDEETYLYHRVKIGEWFLALFQGKYDETYFENLLKISDKHVQIGLPSHYVNAGFSFTRRYVKKILAKKSHYDLVDSFDKIIDLNLDYITVNFQDSEQLKSFHMIEIINYAIKNNAITPYLQAIVNSKTKKIEKYEALMRITDESGKVHSPFTFLDIAKTLGRYCELSRMMLKNTISFLKDKKVQISLNITFEDIEDKETSAYLLNFLHSNGDNHNITFEIVETDDRNNIEKMVSFCEKVHALGAKIAIDDFGTGFSNYNRILALKPDFIKIDGSLIKDIHIRNDFKDVVETIVSWAQKLNIQIVAEYVHCEEVSDIVKELNIDMIQGFLYDEPRNMKEVIF